MTPSIARMMLGATLALAAAPALAKLGDGTERAPWPQLQELTRLDVAGAGAVAYDPASNMLFAVSTNGLAMMHFGLGADAAIVRTIDVAAQSTLANPASARVTSVVCDPRGRGVAVVTIVPRDMATAPGQALFIETRTGRVLGRVTVGFEPVQALWSFGGANVYIANKGSAATGRKGLIMDPPGSVSWIDVDGLADAPAFEAIEQTAVTTIAPNGELLGEALPALRIAPAAVHTPAIDLEPTALAEGGNWLFVAFQANNGFGAFDLISATWRGFHGFGALDVRLDACAKDGPNVVHDFAALPMPGDLDVAFIRGDAYVVTANTGAIRGRIDRGSDAPRPDAAALTWLVRAEGANPSPYADDMLSYDGVGGLEVCAWSGDDDGDGAVDVVHAIGSRGVSLWNVSTGMLEGDSGAMLEDAVAERSPNAFNAVNARVDAGSLDRGPKPSSLETLKFGSSPFAFVALEHPGVIATLDLSAPEAPTFCELTPMGERASGRMNLMHIPADVNPTGDEVLIVTNDAAGRLVVFAVAPPATP